MTNRALTPLQRHIVWLLGDGVRARIVGGKGSRKGLACWASDGGLIIRAYGNPEVFLDGREIIKSVFSNSPGEWWRLTAFGHDLASRIIPDPGWTRPGA